ncbi:MAG: hypothetical protein QF807_08155 [Candidatus Thalassarchaeaceae archaeon]|jgi:hypothetical protein|nr:hypothetical protein [Candidatus Thalassarchaeaceae archaeon]
MDEGVPNSAAPGPTFLGDMNSVNDFLRPQQKNKFVEFLIGFFLPIVLLIVVLLILWAAFLALGYTAHDENLAFHMALLIIGLGLLSCLTIVPITSSVIAIKSSNPTITARGYGAISIVIIWIASIFFLFLILF